MDAGTGAVRVYPTVSKRRANEATPYRSAGDLLAGVQIARAAAHDHAKSGALFDELAAMDQRLFKVAFVSCYAKAVPEFFTADAEFIGGAARNCLATP